MARDPTLHDVAAAAGVHVSTVSKVLGDGGIVVRPGTRERIVAAARDESAEFTHPPLTAVRFPLSEMGALAVDELNRVLAGETPSDVVVQTPPVLVERASLAPPRGEAATKPARRRRAAR